MPRIQSKSWESASNIRQLQKVSQKSVYDHINPLWDDEPLVPFEFIQPKSPQIVAEQPLDKGEVVSNVALSQTSEQTVAGAKTVKFEKIPKKVRIMLDVKKEPDKEKPRKRGSDVNEVDVGSETVSWSGTAGSEAVRRVSEDAKSNTDAQSDQIPQQRKKFSAMSRRSFASSQALSGFTSNIKPEKEDFDSVISSIEEHSPRLTTEEISVDAVSENIDQNKRVGPSVEVSDEQEKEHYGSRMISKGKKASTYTSVFLRPASYYDTFQQYSTGEKTAIQLNLPTEPKSILKVRDKSEDLADNVRFHENNDELVSHKSHAADSSDAIILSQLYYKSYRKVSFQHPMKMAPSFFDQPPKDLDPFANLSLPRVIEYMFNLTSSSSIQFFYY
ncbi:uncharacterized protein LOC142344521 isoform X2 [Convolutriloba macropyga]|uniref:uncharacterized protein LOC142344521 isoform X2 n=1 Tax=Convolutriloba macropyga TaxID=536237 RepID=UPI003F5232E4